ncbi:trehalose phosphate synthase [Micractinium conductrix]|uniref:Trehalose phosphate synthase n=1 Tax=Micractinium conductrix TaxID=554055 RepID=A0A2P6V646_9CHLO|nr:trehalose phosphate synthase [Micractinium conductrix]|eukprot:PSC69557.1 trehalose phosphate synthase [Micractinium conductrix]
MQFTRKSFSNLAALAQGDFGEAGAGAGSSMSELLGGGPLSHNATALGKGSRTSIDDMDGRKTTRCIFVTNHLPLKCSKDEASGWNFEWDPDALVAQAKEGLPDDMEAVYVGCLPVEIEGHEHEEVTQQLVSEFNCHPVFLGTELKNNYYKKFCKQQLWPILHYLIPLNPTSLGRFDPNLWSAYVRANMAFANKLVEVLGSLEEDFVWIHDYHLLVLPSLLRKRFHRIKCGVFLHSPFPSSEIFRTFPRREEIIRSMLNADLVGFHTFDYARHFLSCCSRMLGLEHKTSRGSIIVEYYGRDVGIKIMPTGVNPERLLSGFSWSDTIWRQGELVAQFKGKTVLLGVDDMDIFKGIELKLQAFEQVLAHHPEWRGKLVLVQVTSAARAPGKDVEDLQRFVLDLVESINARYRQPGYEPVVWLERPVPLYERIALYSIADVAVVTATRDGMNLVPYEYVVCRQGPSGGAASGAGGASSGAMPPDKRHSMLVVSEFVGCSPSLSGAIRVNPWSIEAVRDAIYAAIRLPLVDRHIRHEKHWKYVSNHTVQFWAKSYLADLQRFTRNHSKLQCFDLGFALDTFRMVALTSNFRKLQSEVVTKACQRAGKRVFLLDHDGTLVAQSTITTKPSQEVLNMLKHLSSDPRNLVYIISGRARPELADWFSSVENLGLAAEHGFYWRPNARSEWLVQDPEARFGWKDIVQPILQLYTESTDGSFIEVKDSALVWHYRDADPDFGSWQAKELLDHLEGVLSNEPIEVVPGQTIVEVKPQGVSKGKIVERILHDAAAAGEPPDFVLCIGNDRSDEDMFTAMENMQFSPHMPAEVFACTVGQKPSKAPFYVNDPADVVSTLSKLAEVSAAPPAASPSVSFA